MTVDSIITLVGTSVTLLGMIVTIWQASQARSYKNKIKFDLRKIILSGVVERLKKAQDEIRRLPTSSQNLPRGIKANDLIHNIRAEFDYSLGVLNARGPDGDIRGLLGDAQSKLNSYERSWAVGIPEALDVHDLQALVQDGVSQSNAKINQLEGKA